MTYFSWPMCQRMEIAKYSLANWQVCHSGADPGEGYRGQMMPLLNHTWEGTKRCITMKTVLFLELP